MANLRDTEELEDRAFEFVRKSEESAVEAGRKMAKAMGEFVPVEMPALRDMVKEIFDFTEEALKLQREFAHDMLKAARPLRMGRGKTSSRARTTRATRPHGEVKRVA